MTVNIANEVLGTHYQSGLKGEHERTIFILLIHLSAKLRQRPPWQMDVVNQNTYLIIINKK